MVVIVINAKKIYDTSRFSRFWKMGQFAESKENSVKSVGRSISKQELS